MSLALRPLFVNVTWGAGGSTASKSLELAEYTQHELGLTTCLHLTCTNMSQILIDEALERAKAIGIRNILALRGDPPRKEEYGDPNASQPESEEAVQFDWAIDLVRYIRKKYGDYFCLGVAAYPDGHADESHPERQDPKHDLEFLLEKTIAGADFIMTQLFFDIGAYKQLESTLRKDPSGAFKGIPIIPGLMPIQSYQSLRRVTKLSHAKLPAEILSRLETVRGDDEEVKRVGVDILSEIIDGLRKTDPTTKRGYHLYTLNLEKAVSQIVERCKLIRELPTPSISASAIEETSDSVTLGIANLDRRRLSGVNATPRNRVVVEKTSAPANTMYEALEKEAGILKDDLANRENTLATSEGEGALGREATWDDFPNGRWGDARSPGKQLK
jgi:methylenetetrahydrofolate reductase (NADPH)